MKRYKRKKYNKIPKDLSKLKKFLKDRLKNITYVHWVYNGINLSCVSFDYIQKEWVCKSKEIISFQVDGHYYQLFLQEQQVIFAYRNGKDIKYGLAPELTRKIFKNIKETKEHKAIPLHLRVEYNDCKKYIIA